MRFSKHYFDEAAKPIIFCDMDGVLTDFECAFTDLGFGTPDEFDAKYDDPKRFWALVDDKGGLRFWSHMPWMSDGKKLWEFIRSYNPTILTSPARSSDSKEGKMTWVMRELGKDTPVLFEKSEDKQKRATKGAILIDDKESNIDEWNAKGGIGILHKSAEDTIRKLREVMVESGSVSLDSLNLITEAAYKADPSLYKDVDPAIVKEKLSAAENLAAELGIWFNGWQPETDVWYFTDPETHATIAVKSLDDVGERLEQKRIEFAAGKDRKKERTPA